MGKTWPLYWEIKEVPQLCYLVVDIVILHDDQDVIQEKCIVP